MKTQSTNQLEPLKLNHEQTDELRHIWSAVKEGIPKHKHESIDLRLSRGAASITPNQLYMISTRACRQHIALPDWVYDSLGL